MAITTHCEGVAAVGISVGVLAASEYTAVSGVIGEIFK